MVGDTNTVLVADDDPTVVAQVRSWLDDRYRVETATTGDELLSLVGDADAVLVDRDLRTASGTIVAAEIERRATAQTMAILSNDERGAAVHTTAGGSLEKPIERAALLETVDRLLRHARYDDLLDECLTLAAERGTLESRDDFEPDEEYETLQRRLEEVFTALDELVATFDGDDFRAEFATCELGTPTEPHRASERP